MNDDERRRRFAEMDALADEARRVAREDRPVPGGGSRYCVPAGSVLYLSTDEARAMGFHRTWRHHVWDMLKDAWAFCFGRKP